MIILLLPSRSVMGSYSEVIKNSHLRKLEKHPSFKITGTVENDSALTARSDSNQAMISDSENDQITIINTEKGALPTASTTTDGFLRESVKNSFKTSVLKGTQTDPKPVRDIASGPSEIILSDLPSSNKYQQPLPEPQPSVNRVYVIPTENLSSTVCSIKEEPKPLVTPAIAVVAAGSPVIKSRPSAVIIKSQTQSPVEKPISLCSIKEEPKPENNVVLDTTTSEINEPYEQRHIVTQRYYAAENSAYVPLLKSCESNNQTSTKADDQTQSGLLSKVKSKSRTIVSYDIQESTPKVDSNSSHTTTSHPLPETSQHSAPLQSTQENSYQPISISQIPAAVVTEFTPIYPQSFDVTPESHAVLPVSTAVIPHSPSATVTTQPSLVRPTSSVVTPAIAVVPAGSPVIKSRPTSVIIKPQTQSPAVEFLSPVEKPISPPFTRAFRQGRVGRRGGVGNIDENEVPKLSDEKYISLAVKPVSPDIKPQSSRTENIQTPQEKLLPVLASNPDNVKHDFSVENSSQKVNNWKSPTKPSIGAVKYQSPSPAMFVTGPRDNRDVYTEGNQPSPEMVIKMLSPHVLSSHRSRRSSDPKRNAISGAQKKKSKRNLSALFSSSNNESPTRRSPLALGHSTPKRTIVSPSLSPLSRLSPKSPSPGRSTLSQSSNRPSSAAKLLCGDSSHSPVNTTSNYSSYSEDFDHQTKSISSKSDDTLQDSV